MPQLGLHSLTLTVLHKLQSNWTVRFLGNQIDPNQFVNWIESDPFELRIGMRYCEIY